MQRTTPSGSTSTSSGAEGIVFSSSTCFSVRMDMI